MRKLLNKLIAAVSAAAVAIAGVNFGGIGGLNLTARAETVSDFTVTGWELDADCTYADCVLTITSDTEPEIANTTPCTSTTDRIEVKSGVSANITLDNVNIDVSWISGACAFKIEDDSTGNVTIDLNGENTPESGGYRAGLQKNGTYSNTLGKLTIKSESSTGRLTAIGGDEGAGTSLMNDDEAQNAPAKTEQIGKPTVPKTKRWYFSYDKGCKVAQILNGGFAALFSIYEKAPYDDGAFIIMDCNACKGHSPLI